MPFSGINRELQILGGGGGGGGGGSDFHSSAVANYAESIDAPGPSATITYVVQSVLAITTPSVGVGGGPIGGVVIGLLGIATFLAGAVAAGRRRGSGDSSPRPPA